MVCRKHDSYANKALPEEKTAVGPASNLMGVLAEQESLWFSDTRLNGASVLSRKPAGKRSKPLAESRIDENLAGLSCGPKGFQTEGSRHLHVEESWPGDANSFDSHASGQQAIAPKSVEDKSCTTQAQCGELAAKQAGNRSLPQKSSLKQNFQGPRLRQQTCQAWQQKKSQHKWPKPKSKGQRKAQSKTVRKPLQ